MQQLYLRISIVDKTDGSSVADSCYDEIKQRPAFVGIYRIVKPIFDYLSYNINLRNEWQIYYPSTTNELHLISDNPIIFKDDDDNKNMFDREFIMPLTSGKTLYHVGQKRLPIISPGDTMKVDMLIFLQAKRYVAGPKSDWLNVVSQGAIQIVAMRPLRS